LPDLECERCILTMIASCGKRVLAVMAKSDRHNQIDPPADDRLALGREVR
jgi:hypothetical protein